VVEPPTLRALVLADHIYRDPSTGKMFILGTFNRLFVRKVGDNEDFGRETQAYVCLTNLRGSVGLHLCYRDLKTNEVLMQTRPIPVKSNDPFAILEIVLPVPPFPMPHSGVYTFELHAGSDMIGSVRVAVVRLEEEKTGDQA